MVWDIRKFLNVTNMRILVSGDKMILQKKIKNVYIVLLIIKIALTIMSRFNVYIVYQNIEYIIINYLILFLSFYIIRVLLKNKIIKVILCLTTIFLILINTLYTACYQDMARFTFKSPTKIHNIIIEENTWLFTGYAIVYENTGIFFKKVLPCPIETDDGYKPFTNKDYKITWINEDTFVIKYGYGTGIYKDTTVNVK